MDRAGEIAERLAEFALAPLTGSGDALAVMRLSALDWAACAIAGRNEPVARAVRDLVLDEAGRGEATLVGGGRVPARAAALANGAASHALDYDDTHFAHIGHPSVAVLPAALALAERRGAGAGAMIEAALVGPRPASASGCGWGAAITRPVSTRPPRPVRSAPRSRRRGFSGWTGSGPPTRSAWYRPAPRG